VLFSILLIKRMNQKLKFVKTTSPCMEMVCKSTESFQVLFTHVRDVRRDIKRPNLVSLVFFNNIRFFMTPPGTVRGSQGQDHKLRIPELVNELKQCTVLYRSAFDVLSLCQQSVFSIESVSPALIKLLLFNFYYFHYIFTFFRHTLSQALISNSASDSRI